MLTSRFPTKLGLFLGCALTVLENSFALTLEDNDISLRGASSRKLFSKDDGIIIGLVFGFVAIVAILIVLTRFSDDTKYYRNSPEAVPPLSRKHHGEQTVGSPAYRDDLL